MTTFLGTAVESDVRLIVNDASEAKFSDATMLIAVNAALRAVLKDAPASRYTALNAYVDSVTLSALSGSCVISDRWKQAVIHYAAHFLFLADDRSTNNLEMANEQKRLYLENL